MSFSRERLIELYRSNRFLLDKALSDRDRKSEMSASTAIAVAEIGNRLDQGECHTPEAISRYTSRLFSCIAGLSLNSHIVEFLDNVNDSLYYVRTLECQVLKNQNIPPELAAICELFLDEKFTKTRRAIAKYHDDRLASLDRLMELLR